VAALLLAAENGQRDDIGVGLQRFEGAIGAGIVVDNDLVFARVVLKHPSDAPQEHTDGLALVEGRNTDVDQFISADRVTTGGLHRQDRRGVSGLATPPALSCTPQLFVRSSAES